MKIAKRHTIVNIILTCLEVIFVEWNIGLVTPMQRSTAITLPRKRGQSPKNTIQIPKILQRTLAWLIRIQSLSVAYTNTAIVPVMRWPKRSVINNPLAKKRKDAFDFCRNLWYAFRRIATARLLEKIPTVMKITEKITEIFFSVWQVVLESIPIPANASDLVLFIVRKVNSGFKAFQ